MARPTPPDVFLRESIARPLEALVCWLQTLWPGLVSASLLASSFSLLVVYSATPRQRRAKKQLRRELSQLQMYAPTPLECFLKALLGCALRKPSLSSPGRAFVERMTAFEALNTCATEPEMTASTPKQEKDKEEKKLREDKKDRVPSSPRAPPSPRLPEPRSPARQLPLSASLQVRVFGFAVS